MFSKFTAAFLAAACTSTVLFAEEAAAPAAESLSVWKEDFTADRAYTVQRITNDKEKAGSCRKEIKDGAMILYYTFGAKCPANVQGDFGYGVNLDLKGATDLEIRYRTPNGMSNIMTWTYKDASGKNSGDWIRLPASAEWKTVRVAMHTGGIGGVKKAKPVPAKLIAFSIYSFCKRDGVERSMEIDYIRVPAPANAAK